MKRFVFFAFIFLALFSTTFGQLPNGSIAPDFTLQDINGNTHHLYDYLDSGKVVIIDFFEVNCGPCWLYKETHSLAHAYNAWGPPGTNELMIFEVEGIKSTVNQIKGIQKPTNGDWTEGEPFPFIATCPPNGDKITKDYLVNFFPTIYMICRDRRLTLIGRVDTAVIHARMHACPTAPSDSLYLDLMKIDSISPVTCTNSIHPYLKFQNYGTKTIQSAKISVAMDNQAAETLTWTGNLKTYGTMQFDGKNFTLVSDGSHTVKYFISELNGSSGGYKRDTINMRFSSIQSYLPVPFAQNFTDPLFPYNKWTIDNPYKTIPTWERADLGITKALRIPYYNIPVDYTSDLYLPGLSFSGNDKPCMRFEVACTHNNSVIRKAGYDLTQFNYSTDCGNTWELMVNLSSIDYQSAPDDSTYFIPTEAQWKPVTIDLPKLANKESVMFKLSSGPTEGNNMYLRNIRFDNSAGINDETIQAGIIVYPVPAKDALHIQFLKSTTMARFELFNQTGLKVLSTDYAGGKEARLGISNLTPGCYFLRIFTTDYTVTRKIFVY
ncbi:MAG: T9SS type A sorting domain-containing protein [Bacteroidota bacterium]